MKIKKIKVGTFNLKKYLFLYVKGHMGNGDTFGQIEDKLERTIQEVFKIFYTVKPFDSDPRKDFPFAYDKDGNQIGCKKEDYKDA